MKITYHSDKGCRKGCHPVTYTADEGKKTQREVQFCSVDEPGAWWEDKWNCHVDGQDFPLNTQAECIAYGLYVKGYLVFEDTTAFGESQGF